MTFGQLKFRLTKAFPGVDADLVEGWITDCYQEILGLLPWSRLNVQAILMTTPPYSTGKVNVTNGSQAIALTGGAWTAGMSGLVFRVAGDAEEYQFTYAGATTATLDRPYVGATATAAAYAIYQSVYPLPANCRFLDDEAFASFELGPLKKLPIEEGQKMFGTGPGYPPYADGNVPFLGTPRIWWPYMDDGSTPPNMQVRLFPIPDQVYGIPYTYLAEAASPSGTSFTLLPWIQPAALIEGATAKIKRHLKDYPGAQTAKAAFGDAMVVMLSQEAYRRGPVQMEMAGYYSGYRSKRWRR